ncbi:MAG: hypothetical protein WBA99_16915 [Nodosilinea sp.]
MGIISALGLVIVGLLEAPWQVLLLGLLGALYALQRQVWASESAVQISRADIPPAIATDATPVSVSANPEPANSKPNNSAQSPSNEATAATDNGYELTYRGIRYRPSHSIPETASTDQSANQPGVKTEGIYRGQRWQR